MDPTSHDNSNSINHEDVIDQSQEPEMERIAEDADMIMSFVNQGISILHTKWVFCQSHLCHKNGILVRIGLLSGSINLCSKLFFFSFLFLKRIISQRDCYCGFIVSIRVKPCY